MSYSIVKDVGRDDVAIARIKGGKRDGEFLLIRPEGVGKKSFELRDGELIPVLSKNGANGVYIAGARRSGKTTLLSNILESTDKDIMLFTRLDDGEDPSLNIENPVERVDLNQLLDQPMDWKECTSKIAIFDDAFTSPNKIR